MPDNVLAKKFDPATWQWEENGKTYRLADLSRDDRLQVACSAMEALERAEELQAQLGSLMRDWRQGKIEPGEAC